MALLMSLLIIHVRAAMLCLDIFYVSSIYRRIPFETNEVTLSCIKLEEEHDTFEIFCLGCLGALLAPYDCLPFAPRFGRLQHP